MYVQRKGRCRGREKKGENLDGEEDKKRERNTSFIRSISAALGIYGGIRGYLFYKKNKNLLVGAYFNGSLTFQMWPHRQV
jgi:hypothetical protein